MADQQSLVRQLHRIEGQIRGIENMIVTDRGLVPTVQQLLAARSALHTVMVNYVGLFLEPDETERIVLTKDQAKYLFKLME